MREASHHPHPQRQHHKAGQKCDSQCYPHHGTGPAKPHSDLGANPEPEIRSSPRGESREEPTDDQQAVREPARHASVRHDFRAMAATPRTVRMTEKPTPMATG